MATFSDALRDQIADAMFRNNTDWDGAQVRLRTSAQSGLINSGPYPARLTLSTPAFEAALGNDGAAVFAAIADDGNADGNANPVQSFAIVSAAGSTLMTGTAGATGSGADLELTSVIIAAGDTVSIPVGQLSTRNS